jgi:hypothetical protein
MYLRLRKLNQTSRISQCRELPSFSWIDVLVKQLRVTIDI